MKAWLTTAWLHLRGAVRSWTIWFNGIVAAGWALLPSLQDAFPQLQNYLPVKGYQWAMALIILGNIAMRFRTKTSLAAKAAPREPAG